MKRTGQGLGQGGAEGVRRRPPKRPPTRSEFIQCIILCVWAMMNIYNSRTISLYCLILMVAVAGEHRRLSGKSQKVSVQALFVLGYSSTFGLGIWSSEGGNPHTPTPTLCPSTTVRPSVGLHIGGGGLLHRHHWLVKNTVLIHHAYPMTVNEVLSMSIFSPGGKCF